MRLRHPRATRHAARLCGSIAVVVVCAALATVGGASARTDVRSADVAHLTWALGAPIRGLEYTHSADSGTATVVSLGCETLVKYDRIGRLRPALATSFTTPNTLTRIYTIRKNVKFWDGSTLTPEDVVFSLQRAASSKAGSQIAAFYTAVKSITAQGNRIVIRLKQPDPYFRYAVAVTYILQKKYWQANLKDIGTPQKLTMCTGPHRFTKFQGDGTTELVAFDGYWGGRPAVRAITLKVIVNEATRLLAMRQGEIDGSFRLSQDVIDQWKRLPNTTIQLAPELRTAYLSLDTAVEPWNDVHVRRAVAYSFDKAGLVKAVLRGYGDVAPTMPPPEQWGDVMTQPQVHAFYRTLPKYSYSLAKAKAELAQSDFPDGFKATLPYPDSEQTLGKAALSLSENLKKLGIDLTVKEVPTDAWFATLYNHPSPMGPQIISWGVDYPDPADALHFIYDSKAAVKNNFNTANYKSAQMDKLLATQQNSVATGVRAAAIRRALRLASVDVPYIPIWYQDIAMGLSSKLRYRGWGTWYLYQPWALDISAR
jgi:peptide/nickel transport system substrate-binding protein